MADNDLRILISASLNVGKSVGDINEAIKAIEKHPSLQKIKLKIDIDQNFTQTINGFINAVGKMKKISDEQNKTVSENVEIYKRLDGTVQQVTQKVLKNGEIIQKTKTIHDENKKAMQDEGLAAQKLAENIEKANKAQLDSITVNKNKRNLPTGFVVKSSEGYTTTTQRLESDGQTLKNSSVSTNYLKQRLDELREQKRINKEAEALDRAHFMAIRDNNKRKEDMEKLHYLANQKNREFDLARQKQAAKDRESLLAMQNRAELQVLNLNRRYGAGVDSGSLNNYLNQIKALNTNMPNFRAEALRITQEINKIGASASASSSHILSFGEALRTAFVKFPVWLISGTVFTNISRFFTEGIRYVNELNDALTQISIVTNRSQSEVAKLGLEYNKIAKEMGVTTKQIADASVTFYRQGLSQAQVMERVKTTTEYAKISNLDFTKSAEILTATTNSMKIGIERASDVFAYLGDATATGADEVGRAFQKTGGTAGALNLEFEKVASWIAVVSSRTREGAETIGQSIKSILARIQNMKEQGFSEEDGTQVNQVAKSLNAVGIALLDNNGQFRNFGKVMDELGAKWSSLDSRQKAYLSTTIAGTYQQSRFFNLMEGYKETIPLYEKALQSAGTTTHKFGLYQEGNQAAIDRMKAALEGLWQSTFNSQAIKGVANSLASLISSLDSLVKSIGAFPVGVGLATTALLFFSSNVRGFVMTAGTQMLSWLGVSKVNFNTGALAVNRFAYSMGLGATSARAFTTALVGLSRAVLPLAVLSAVTYGISMIAESFMDAREEAKKMEDRNKTIVNSWTTQREAVEKLKNEYFELSNATNGGKNFLNTEQEQKYYEVTGKIAELMPNLVKEIDSKGRYHLKNAEAIQKELESTEKLVAAEQRRQVASGQDAFQNLLDERKKILNDIEFVQDQLKYKTKQGINSQAIAKLSDSELAAAEVKLIELQAKIADSSDRIKEQMVALTSTAAQLAGVKINDSLGKELDNIVKSLDVEGLKPEELASKVTSLSQLIIKLNSIKELRNNGSPDSADAAFQEEQNFIRVAKSIGLTDDQINKLINSVFGFKKANTETAVDVEKLFIKLAGAYEETASAVRPLNDAIDKLKHSQSLSSSEISNLLKKYPELFSAFTTENGLLKINVEALEKKRNAVIDGMQDSIKSESNQVKAQEQALIQKLKFYGAEIEAIDSVAQAKEALAKATAGLADKQVRGELSDQQVMDETNRIYGELGPQVESIAKAKEAIKSLQEASKSNFNFENKINSPKSEKKEAHLKDALDYIELEKEVVNSLNETYEARKKLIDLEKKQIDIIEKQKDYNSAIERTNELISNQSKAVSDLNTANFGITKKADEARMNAVKNKGMLGNIKRLNSDFALPADVEEAKKYVKEYFDTWFNSSGDASESYKKFINSFAERSKLIHDDTSLSVEDRNKEMDALKKQKEDFEQFFKVLQVYKHGWTENVNKINEMNTAIESSHESLNKLRKEAHDIKIAGLDDQLKEIQRTLETFPESSSQYRAELERLIQLNKEKQNVEHQTAEEGRARIASGKLSAEQIVYENEMIKSLSNSWWEYQKVIKDNEFKIISSTINESAESLKKYDDQLKISKERMELFDEKSKEYSAELLNQAKILKDKLAAEESHEAMIRKSMETVGLTAEKYAHLKDELRKTILAQADTIGAMKQNVVDQQRKLADNVIEIYKTMYEKQKEVRQKALQKEEEELDKSHKKKVEALDKEMKKYEELVQAKLKALDDKASEDDYNKQLAKMQKERDEIQKQIDIKSLNDSPEAKAALAELKKKLDEKNEEIEKFTTNRSRELQKKGLQEQLDEKKKSVDAEKEAADKNLENEKERIKKQKEHWDRYYDNLINDERRFTQIREEIMRGSTERVKQDFDGFKAFLVANNETIGQSISLNLSDKMDTVSNKLQTTSEMLKSTVGNLANEFNNNLAKALDNVIAKLKEMENLSLTPKQNFESIESILKRMQERAQQYNNTLDPNQRNFLHNENLKDSARLNDRGYKNQYDPSRGEYVDPNGRSIFDSANPIQTYNPFGMPNEDFKKYLQNKKDYEEGKRQQEAANQNSELRKRYNISSDDYTYEQLKRVSRFDTGGLTPAFGHNPKLAWLDEKELVLNKVDTSNLLKVVDITRNIIGQIKSSFDFSKLVPSSVATPAGTTGNNLTIRIDNVIGDKKGAEDVADTIYNKLHTKGLV